MKVDGFWPHWYSLLTSKVFRAVFLNVTKLFMSYTELRIINLSEIFIIVSAGRYIIIFRRINRS